MLMHPVDTASSAEWRALLTELDFGQVIAAGHGGYPLVVPSHYVYDGGDEVWLHLARPNPVWAAIEADPRVVFAVVTDYAYIPAAWNADGGLPPERGVPTTYYSAVQLHCRAQVVDDEEGKFEILRRQLRRLEPAGSDRVPPSTEVESDREMVPGIRGLRLHIEDVLAKMKYGGNKTPEERAVIAQGLAERDGPHDARARQHLLRRGEQAG